MATEKGVWEIQDLRDKILSPAGITYDGLGGGFAWGRNTMGDLGQNNLTLYSSPVQIPGNWATIQGGGACIHGVKTDGTLWAWGRNDQGRLGVNQPTNSKYSSPVQIPGTTWSSDRLKLSNRAGISGYAIKTDGTMWSWGDGTNGRLGQNDTNSYSSPRQIPGSTWDVISNSYNGQFAVKTDGTLWSWGWNSNGAYGGQLGHNNKTNYSSPKQVGSETTWDNVITGAVGDMVLAHKSDGTLWSWGYNGQGQLGISNKTTYSSPKQIPGSTWSSEITAGSHSCYAVKTDGTLWSWGYNTWGGLGQNNRTEHNSPVQIPGTTWSKLGSKGRTVYAVKTDGTAWAWGKNEYGQLGVPSIGTGHRSSPVQIPGTDWDIIEGGDNHGVGRKNL